MESILYKDSLVQNARELCTEGKVSSVGKGIVWLYDKGEESCGCKTLQKWLHIAILSLSLLLIHFLYVFFLVAHPILSLFLFLYVIFFPFECTVQVMPHPYPSWATWYATAPSPPTTTPCLCLVHPRNT